jgi:hypothetical protein
VLVEPQADQSLESQKAILSQYLDKISLIHEKCRKANKLSTCSEASLSQPSLVPLIRVELPPIFPPGMSRFYFAINGNAIPAAQSVQLAANTRATLFDAAKALNANTVNVDLAAYIPSAYVSSVSMNSTQIQPTGAPQPLAGVQLAGQQIALPSYVSQQVQGSMIIVYHSDASHPCPMRRVSGFSLIDQSCLTIAGRILEKVARANAAVQGGIQRFNPPPMDAPLNGAITDCFGTGTPVIFGVLSFNETSTIQAVRIAYRAFLPMDAGSILLAIDDETRDPADWRQQRQLRLNDLSNSQPISTGSACAPHIQ